MRPLWLALALAVLAGLVAATEVGADSYADGDIVSVTGLITDSGGAPIPRVQLVFEASRRSFSLRKLRRVEENPVRVSTLTDERGEYELDWKWHRYYNHFELAVVVAVRQPGGKERLEVLAELDVSQRMRLGSPVVAPIMVEDTAFLVKFRDFLASLKSADELRLYDELGKPDKVDTLSFPDRREVSWWFFKLGRTYRFRDGRLDGMVEFEPVESF